MSSNEYQLYINLNWGERSTTMTKMTITIQDWKHVEMREGRIGLFKVLRRALLWAMKQPHLEEPTCKGINYNDYEKSGVELKITMK